jgi:hypothetical protein
MAVLFCLNGLLDYFVATFVGADAMLAFTSLKRVSSAGKANPYERDPSS